MRRLLAVLVTLALHAAVVASAGWQPLDRLAKDVAKGAPEGAPLKVGVLEFPTLDGSKSDGSVVVQEQLTTLLAADDRLQVLERRLIGQLMQEKRLESTGLIDGRDAGRAGGLLGVDAVVSGTLHDVEDGRTEVNARMIECRTGRVLSAATAVVKRTWPEATKPPPVAVAQPPPAYRNASFAPPREPRVVRRSPREERGFLDFFLTP